MKSWLLAGLLSLGADIAMAQTVAGVDLQRLSAQSRPHAEAARSVLAELVTDANAVRMGLPNANAAARAEVGRPFADFMVDLTGLAAFRASVDPVTLLRPTGMIVYPLATERGGVSSITLANREGRWQAVSFGSPARTRAMVETRAEAARRDNGLLDEYFQVRIAPFNAIFIGRIAGGELWLTPAVSIPKYKLKRGASVRAAAIFSGLAEMAANDPGGFR